MIFNKKKKKEELLLKSFGKIKDVSFNFDWIKRYFNKSNSFDAFQIISDKTCNDLDFEELFMFIDRTNSRVGQQFLYNKLRTIPNKSNSQNEELINLFSAKPKFRVSVQKQLEHLNNTNAYFISTLFHDSHVKQPKWFFITKILSFTSLLSVILIPFIQQMVFVLFGVFLINLGIHFWNKRNLFQYLESIPQLIRLSNVANELYQNELLKHVNPNLLKSLGKINKVKNRMIFFKHEARFNSEAAAFVNGIFEIFKITFLLEPLFLFDVLKLLDTIRNEVEDIFNFVGEIDSLNSIASLRSGCKNYCIPQIVDNQNQFCVHDIYHPLIVNCVSNTILTKNKSVLLTGSNMSGKTSFIRTIGLNAITAQTINTCFAKQFSMPKLRVYSAIRISDDLLNDKSYYFEEVLTIKEMLAHSNENVANLFILDEIFKGTNTVERISAAKAVLTSLANNRNIVFVSTHDIELADMLDEDYALYHFSEHVFNNTVDFDYKLKDGKLKNRNAIRILQLNNYPKNIVDEAYHIAETFDNITKANTNSSKLKSLSSQITHMVTN